MVLHASLDDGDLPSGEVLAMSPGGSGVSGMEQCQRQTYLHQLAS
jgi:hypothetical protein